MTEFPDKMAERLHDEGYIHQKDVTHVTLVYSDGEVCMTKGHQLYGMRNIHQHRPPFIPEAQDPGFFPTPSGKTSHAIVKNMEEANLIRDALWEWWLKIQEAEREREAHFFDYKKK